MRALLDYIEHDHALAEFLDDFPTVSRTMAITITEHMKQVSRRTMRLLLEIVEYPGA